MEPAVIYTLISEQLPLFVFVFLLFILERGVVTAEVINQLFGSSDPSPLAPIRKRRWWLRGGGTQWALCRSYTCTTY